MSGIRIYCPNCGRVLGDTEHSVDCRINCRGCKTTQHIRMKVARLSDYLELIKQEQPNDKSK